MREIKFRAWVVSPMKSSPDKMIYQNHKGVYGLSNFVKDMTQDTELMQYTGLKDKNGRERYEGDIYRLKLLGIETHIEYQIAVVEWVNEVACFAFNIKEPTSDYKGYMAFNDDNIMIAKHLGNIYENKDLL